jgi:hypothetical protein
MFIASAIRFVRINAPSDREEVYTDPDSSLIDAQAAALATGAFNAGPFSGVQVKRAFKEEGATVTNYRNDRTTMINKAGVSTLLYDLSNPGQKVNLFKGEIEGEVVAGIIDGINDTFTLGQMPKKGGEKIYLNGARQTRGADYTINGVTVVFVPARVPQIGDRVTTDYPPA